MIRISEPPALSGSISSCPPYSTGLSAAEHRPVHSARCAGLRSPRKFWPADPADRRDEISRNRSSWRTRRAARWNRPDIRSPYRERRALCGSLWVQRCRSAKPQRQLHTFFRARAAILHHCMLSEPFGQQALITKRHMGRCRGCAPQKLGPPQNECFGVVD